MTDILSWLTPSDPTKHLEGNANPVYTRVDSTRVWWVKSAQGFPYDVMPYDADYLYLWWTENGWTDPSVGKAFVEPIPLAPRQIMMGLPSCAIDTIGPEFQTFANCAASPNQQLKRVKTSVSGPWAIDHGGDVGVQPTIVIAYQWGAGLTTREQYYLAKGFGLVRWDTAALGADGMYAIGQTSVFNKLVAGGCPPINAPCIK
jgi:hypothetical protein